jgi:hypothetical protein
MSGAARSDRPPITLSLKYSQVHPSACGILRIRTTAPDIGAGTGRDASLLLRLGIVEIGRRALNAHPELEGRIVGGSLPRGMPESVAGKYGSRKLG